MKDNIRKVLQCEGMKTLGPHGGSNTHIHPNMSQETQYYYSLLYVTCSGIFACCARTCAGVGRPDKSVEKQKAIKSDDARTDIFHLYQEAAPISWRRQMRSFTLWLMLLERRSITGGATTCVKATL